MTYAPVSEIIISTANSSTVALGSSATFTGTGEQVFKPGALVSVKTDAIGTLFFDFSPNGTNWDSTFPPTGFAIAAGINEFHTATKGARFFRVRVVNGSSAQTFMRLHTEFGTYKQGNLPVNSTIGQDADAIVVRSLSENITLGEGKMAGYSVTNKFGKNSDIDTGSVPEDIWEGGGEYPGFPDTAGELIEVVSDSADDAAAGTGARTVQLQGLDENFELQSETVTLNGTTPVDTVGTYVRMHTARTLSAGSGAVNAGTITFRHTTTTANVFAAMKVGKNQTNVAAYTIPAGKTGYIRKVHGSLRRGTSGTVDGFLWIRNFGEVFRARRPFTIGVNARLVDDVSFGLRMGEKTDITMRIDIASANNCDVTGGFDIILVDN